MTQETAAERCDLSVKYWGQIERCQVNASLEILDKIAAGLEISAVELLSESADKIEKM